MLSFFKKLKQKITFQKVINILVIMLVILWVGEFVWNRIPLSPYDEFVLPDDIVALDKTIDEFLIQLEPNFSDLMESPSPEIPIMLNQTHNKKPLSAPEIYQQSHESVVYITTEDPWGLYFGSGTIIGTNGVILTNYHIIDGQDKVVVTLFDGRSYRVTSVLVANAVQDIAVLKITAHELPALPIGNNNDIEIGEPTYVIGHGEEFLYTLSTGIVSGIRNYVSTGEGTQLQITNPISGGNSGGALLNQYGELIGVPMSVLAYEDNIVQVQNINFAVPIDSVRDLLGI